MKKLPISDYKDEILKAVEDNDVVLITAETGAGKSTQVPQYLLEAGYDIVVTEPRRLAARTVAERVAYEIGEELGGTVGFRTAYERKDSHETQCLFATDGLALVREMMGHGRHDVLVLDEVHEWNLNIEVLCAWAKMQIEAGVDFKVVVMSATLESEKLSRFFNDAPVINVPGRLYPVTEESPGKSIEMDVYNLILQGRNTLVFMPGKKEINNLIEDLEEMHAPAVLLPLHGQLSVEDQAKVFDHYGRPKCVVSTNVAQTSVTIDDIDAVVDSGTERRVELVDGVEGLYLKPISQSDREQRKGRAGRTKPGVYIDWCEERWSRRPKFPKAEILRTRLDQTVLRLAEAGIDAEELSFFHQPPRDQIHEAKRALRAIGCMREDGSVTSIGHKVAKLPVSVQYGRMIVEAHRLNVVDDVITVAALLEQEGITQRPKNRFDTPAWKKLVTGETESDIMAQLTVYNTVIEKKMSNDEMWKNGVFVKAFHQARQKRRHLVDSLRRKIEFGSTGNRKDILRSVCAGMADQVFCLVGDKWTDGSYIHRSLDRNSVVSEAEWIVGIPWDLQFSKKRRDRYTGEVSTEKQTLNLIKMATKISLEMVEELVPQFVARDKDSRLVYDSARDCVVSARGLSFKGRLVKELREPDSDNPEAAKVFAEWLAHQFLPYTRNEAVDEILRVNQKTQSEARSMNIRYGYTKYKVYSHSELVEHYLGALDGARCVSEITCPEDLRLPVLDEGSGLRGSSKKSKTKSVPKEEQKPASSDQVTDAIALLKAKFGK